MLPPVQRRGIYVAIFWSEKFRTEIWRGGGRVRPLPRHATWKDPTPRDTEAMSFLPVSENEEFGSKSFAINIGLRNLPHFGRTLINLLEKAGLRRMRFHDLRPTFASLLLQNQESLTYAKNPLGNARFKKTVDVYGLMVPGSNQQAVNRSLALDVLTFRNRPRREHSGLLPGN
jgi:integrase